MTATERREEIIETLYHRRKETMSNLAEEFGVSLRTINYDIEKLSLSHPIITVQGNGGGVEIMEGCYSGRKYLNPEQQELLENLKSNLSDEDLQTMNSILKTFAPAI